MTQRAIVLHAPVEARSLLRTALGIIVLAGVVVLPLIFIPGIDDEYALPKTVALRILALVGGVVFLGYLMVGGPIDRSADATCRRVAVVLCRALHRSHARLGGRGSKPCRRTVSVPGFGHPAPYVAAFFAARLSLGTPAGVRTLLIALAGTGLVVAVYAIAQQVGIDPFWSGPIDPRPISSIGQANNLGAYLDLVVVAVLGLWVGAGQRGRITLAVVGAVSVIAIGLTLSRGAYLALAAVAAIWLVPIARSRVTRRRIDDHCPVRVCCARCCACIAGWAHDTHEDRRPRAHDNGCRRGIDSSSHRSLAGGHRSRRRPSPSGNRA